MSTVLWANVKVGDKLLSDSNDLVHLYKNASALDRFCQKNGLPAFSALFDDTDMRVNMNLLDLPAGMDSTNDLMCRDGHWVSLRDGYLTLTVLRKKLQDSKQRIGIFSDKSKEVIGELDTVIAWLDKEQAAGLQAGDSYFNFCVVM